MSSLTSLQTGTATITRYSYTTDVTVTSVTLSKSFVISHSTYATSSTNVPEGAFTTQLSSATNIHFERGIANDWVITIYWQLIQIEGATVQRGESVIVYGTDITITSVDTTKAFAIVTVRGGSVSTLGHLITSIKITTATNLNIVNQAGVESPVADWVVIVISDCSVQVSTGDNTTYSSKDITINAVVLSNSLIFFSCSTSGSQTINPAQLPVAYFVDTVTVRIKSYNTAAKVHSLFVVTCSLWSVQRFYAEYSSNSNDVTITTIVVASTMSLLSGSTNIGYASTASTTFDWGNFGCKQIITSTTNAQITRGANSGNFSIASQIWCYGAPFLSIFIRPYEFGYRHGAKAGVSIG
jgi:hypothetical protein